MNTMKNVLEKVLDTIDPQASRVYFSKYEFFEFIEKLEGVIGKTLDDMIKAEMTDDLRHTAKSLAFNEVKAALLGGKSLG